MASTKQSLKRIRQMERHLDHALAAVKRLSGALDKWESVQAEIAALEAYYGSEFWRQDLADDEAGLLPEGLKRGVLSEDGVWNLLADCKELKDRLGLLSK